MVDLGASLITYIRFSFQLGKERLDLRKRISLSSN